jgi:hypothetical protein
MSNPEDDGRTLCAVDHENEIGSGVSAQGSGQPRFFCSRRTSIITVLGNTKGKVELQCLLPMLQSVVLCRYIVTRSSTQTTLHCQQQVFQLSLANMYFSALQVALFVAIPLANAWPTAILDAAGHDPALLKQAEEAVGLLKERQATGNASAATAVFEPVPIFNAKAQYIDVTAGSGHEYVAPGPNDLRGPCPGLNAFANHVSLTLHGTVAAKLMSLRTSSPTTGTPV